MRKILFSWPLATLGLALFSSGCNQSKESPTTDSPAAALPDKPAAISPPKVSAAPASRLIVAILEGTLTVSLNGRKVGDYPSTIKVDVTSYLKPGKNTIDFDWVDNTRGLTQVEYALAATPDKYSDITSFQLENPNSLKAGHKTLEFNLPNPDGTLPPAEPGVTPEASAPVSGDSSVPAPDVTVPPSPLGTDGNSIPKPDVTIPPSPLGNDKAVTPPSSGVKAIMDATSLESPVSISLNGQNVGDVQSYLKLDVGRYLKPGTNTVEIKWSKQTYFDVKIAYFSKDANNYRNISRTRLAQSDTTKPGSRLISFQVPSS